MKRMVWICVLFGCFLLLPASAMPPAFNVAYRRGTPAHSIARLEHALRLAALCPPYR